MTRQLATKRYIKEVQKHPNADALDLVKVDGWQVVAKLGEFQEGDPCLFIEIDSFIPADDERFAFLAKNGTKKDPSGRERIRLKTVKLRKELSQGLALPWSMFPELHDLDVEDYSEALDIIKYERPEPKTADAAGHFPNCIPKTDEERIQNVWDKYKEKYLDVKFIPTLKLDGSSCTVAYFGLGMQDYWKGDTLEDTVFNEGEEEKVGEIALCSRNLQLKHNPDSHFWKAAEKGGVIDAVCELGKIGNFAIQGEVLGPGIQGNKEKFNDYKFYAFALYDIDERQYIEWTQAKKMLEDLDVNTVPDLFELVKRPFWVFDTLEKLLDFADGPSINAKYREGLVWKSVGLDEIVSFKTISNKWLLKTGE